jgi:hypothetical protein
VLLVEPGVLLKPIGLVAHEGPIRRTREGGVNGSR